MAMNNKGYDPSIDYSLAIKNSTSASERAQLQKERQAKIDDLYGGTDPYKGTSDIMGAGSPTSGGSDSSKSYTADSGSYTKPTSGGSSSSTVTPYSPAASSSGSSNYHQDAINAAARGDWSAVGQALAARQAKIDASGGNDYGITNTQILSQLKSQYGGGYNNLSVGMQDNVGLSAGLKLPYTTGYGTTGTVYKDKGWEEGRDYLDEAQRLAAAGDLEGAYETLRSRGAKMAATGSTGNGITQDQAYAMIHQLYNQSDVARSQYQNERNINQQRLQEHQTQFGLRTVPALAGKQILSTDGKYWIIYDQSGTPAITRPNNQSSRRYSDEEIALMSQYYAPGGAENFSELERQLHNLAVVSTGVGRLIDQDGNYASGAALQPIAANDWTGLPQTDRYQDRAALQAILDRINSGTTYAGGSVTVPTGNVPRTYTPVSGSYSGYGRSGGGYGSYGYGDNDLTAYLRQMYDENLNAQLYQLQAAYEQNLAESRAHDDLIAQSYMSQRNQAAAQNDLQRMYMNEMGAAQGLNTGAAGQLALALGSDLQNSLAMLGSAEAQDLSESNLARQQLGIGYRGDVASATAQSNASLAGALYSEYVRQMEAAQEEARWQAQMAYQRQQDALTQANWERQFQYTQQAAAAKSGTKGTGSTGSAGSGKPKLTYAQTLAAIENGQVTDAVREAYDYYMGSGAYEGFYGTKSSANVPAGGVSDDLEAVRRSLGEQLSSGREDRALSYLRSVWDGLTSAQQQEVQSLVARYGLQYNP